MKFQNTRKRSRTNCVRIFSSLLIFLSFILPTAPAAFAVCPGTTAPSFLPNGDVNPELTAQIDAYVACAQAENRARYAENAAADAAAAASYQAQTQAAAQAEAQAAAQAAAAKEAASHNAKDVAQIASLTDEVKKLSEELSALKSKLAEQTVIAEKTKSQAAEIEKLQQSSKTNEDKFTEANTKLNEASKKITELLSKVTSTEAEKQELITAKSKEATVSKVAKIADVKATVEDSKGVKVSAIAAVDASGKDVKDGDGKVVFLAPIVGNDGRAIRTADGQVARASLATTSSGEVLIASSKKKSSAPVIVMNVLSGDNQLLSLIHI